MDFFSLKKLFTFFVEPYGIFLFLLALAIYFLYNNKIRLVKFLLTTLFILMIVLAYPPFSNILVNGLEKRYSKYVSVNEFDYIHVLGSGRVIDDSQPLSSKISNSGLKRVVEGVILQKTHSDSKLVFTGHSRKTDMSIALLNAEIAIHLGVNKENIIIGEGQRDTKEEVLFMKNLLHKNDNIILVTSATHMRRALKLYNSHGLNPIPAPTDFHRNVSLTYWQLPSISSLYESKVAIHEYLGIFWDNIVSIFNKKNDKHSIHS